MRVCLMLEGQEGITWEQWVVLTRAAEDAGLEAVFRSDHYRSIVRGEPAGALDAWATLAALAAVTSRIRLGTMVSPITFRSPWVLAKSVVTVDRISGGRVELGIGAGWYEAEHESYRIPFPALGRRLGELEQQLEELQRQWSPETPDIQPKPMQQPRPNVIVGGKAMPRTVRAAVRFADEYNTAYADVEEIRARRAAVDDAADAAGRARLCFSMTASCLVGRDRSELDGRLGRLREIGAEDRHNHFAGTVDEVVEELRAYEAAGVERVMLRYLLHEDTAMVPLLGEVASALA